MSHNRKDRCFPFLICNYSSSNLDLERYLVKIYLYSQCGPVGTVHGLPMIVLSYPSGLSIWDIRCPQLAQSDDACSPRTSITCQHGVMKERQALREKHLCPQDTNTDSDSVLTSKVVSAGWGGSLHSNAERKEGQEGSQQRKGASECKEHTEKGRKGGCAF